MRSVLVRSALGLLAPLVLAPPADWLLWKHSAARGIGYGEVTVSRVVVARSRRTRRVLRQRHNDTTLHPIHRPSRRTRRLLVA